MLITTYTLGPQDSGTLGPLSWTLGPLTLGPLDPWTLVLLDLWPLDLWTLGPLAHLGPLDPWPLGLLDPWKFHVSWLPLAASRGRKLRTYLTSLVARKGPLGFRLKIK